MVSSGRMLGGNTLSTVLRPASKSLYLWHFKMHQTNHGPVAFRETRLHMGPSTYDEIRRQ